METRELLLLINAQYESLQQANNLLIRFGQEGGVSAEAIDRMNKGLGAAAKTTSTLSAEADKAAGRVTALANKAENLRRAMVKATDEKQVAQLNTALQQTEKELADARLEAEKLAKTTDGIGVRGKKSAENFKLFGKNFNIGPLTSKLSGLQGVLGSTGLAAGGLGGSLASMASTLGPIGVAIGAVVGVVLGLGKALGASVDIAKEYEASLASLEAITGLAGNGLDDISDRAQNFVVRVRDANGEIQLITLGAADAAQAFEVVGSRVPELLKVPDALDQVTRQAKVLSETSRDLGFDEAVNGLTVSINQFLPVNAQYANEIEKANAIVRQGEILTNQLAAAQQLGAVPVTGLSQSLQKFGAVATANNITSAESIALAEVLGQKFEDQATVGTNLRNIISILAADTTELGLSFEGADGQAQGIEGSIRALRDRLASISDPAERAAFLTKQFGRENQTAAQILVNNIGKVGELTEELEKQAQQSLANGAAAQQAAINADTYAASQERLRTTLAGVGNSIGQTLLPILTSLNNFFEELVRRSGEAFEGLQPLRDAFAALFDAISNLLGELGLLNNDMDVLGIILQGISFALESVVFGVRAAATGVEFFVEGIQLLVRVARGAQLAVAELARSFTNFFSEGLSAFDGLGSRLSSIFSDQIGDVNEIFGPTLDETKRNLEEAVRGTFNGVDFSAGFGNVARELKANLEEAIEGVDPEQATKALEQLGPAIRGKIQDAINRGDVAPEDVRVLEGRINEVLSNLTGAAVVIPQVQVETSGATGTGGGGGAASDDAKKKAEKAKRDAEKAAAELAKTQAAIRRAQAQVEQDLLQLEVDAAVAGGDAGTAIAALNKQVQAAKLAELAELERSTEVTELAKVDPAAAAKLRQDILTAINATYDEQLEQGIKQITEDSAEAFADNILESYSTSVQGLSGRFSIVQADLQSQVASLATGLDFAAGADSVEEVSSFLNLLGLDAAGILGDASTVEQAVAAVEGQVTKTQQELLTKTTDFNSQFVASTQQVIDAVRTQIDTLSAQEAAGTIGDADLAKLEELRQLYLSLTKDVADSRKAVGDLKKEIQDSTEEVNPFAELSEGAKGLAKDIIAAGDALGKSLDPDAVAKFAAGFTAAQQVVGATQEALNSVFEFRLQKAEQTNQEELEAIDAQIAEAEKRAAAGAEGQEKIIENLNARKKTLEEEQANEVRKVREQQFKVDKAFNLVTAITNGATAFTKALASAAPPVNFVLAGLTAAATAAQVATIATAKPSFFKGTRFVTASAGNYGRDTIEANLHHGERVVGASLNKAHYGDYNAIEDGRVPVGAVSGVAALPAALQKVIAANPSHLVDMVYGDRPEAAAAVKEYLDTKRPKAFAKPVSIGAEYERLAGAQTKGPKLLERLLISQAAGARLDQVHRASKGGVEIDYGKLAKAVAKEISSQLPRAQYKEDWRDSSVNYNQLEVQRFGFKKMLDKLEEISTTLKKK